VAGLLEWWATAADKGFRERVLQTLFGYPLAAAGGAVSARLRGVTVAPLSRR